MKSRPIANIRLRDSEGRREVYDIVRNRFVALTLNGMTRRCDIVVYDESVRPYIIVECKNESVPLTQKVLDQACRYNLVLQVPYLCLTNGAQQICCQVDFEEKRVVIIPKLPNCHKKS